MLRYIAAPMLLAVLVVNMPFCKAYAGLIAGGQENIVLTQLKEDSLFQLKKPVLQPKKYPGKKPISNTAGQTETAPQAQGQTEITSQNLDQYAQLGPEQSQQGQSSYPPAASQGTTGATPGYAPTTTDMQRRGGGQGRTNAPGGQQPPTGQQQMMPGQQSMPMQPGGQQMMQPGGQPQPMGQQQQQQMMPGQQGMPVQQDPSSMQMPQSGQQMVMPQGGQTGCKIQLSEDRTSIALIDSSGQESEHVSLGQDRVQKIFKAPDGSWNVVIFKVRQRQQFGAIAVNMAECDAQEARDIRSVPAQIEFQGPEMVLTYSGNASERYPLSNKNLP